MTADDTVPSGPATSNAVKRARCPLCPESFGDPSSYKEHLGNAHGLFDDEGAETVVFTPVIDETPDPAPAADEHGAGHAEGVAGTQPAGGPEAGAPPAAWNLQTLMSGQHLKPAIGIGAAAIVLAVLIGGVLVPIVVLIVLLLTAAGLVAWTWSSDQTGSEKSWTPPWASPRPAQAPPIDAAPPAAADITPAAPPLDSPSSAVDAPPVSAEAPVVPFTPPTLTFGPPPVTPPPAVDEPEPTVEPAVAAAVPEPEPIAALEAEPVPEPQPIAEAPVPEPVSEPEPIAEAPVPQPEPAPPISEPEPAPEPVAVVPPAPQPEPDPEPAAQTWAPPAAAADVRGAEAVILSPEEIASKQFHVTGGGYSMEEVRQFLASVAASYRDAMHHSAPGPIPDFAAIGEEVSRVLQAASETAESLKVKADAEAGTIRAHATEEAKAAIEDAQAAAARLRAEADRLYDDARAEATRLTAEARQRAESAVKEAVERRDRMEQTRQQLLERIRVAETMLGTLRQEWEGDVPPEANGRGADHDTADGAGKAGRKRPAASSS